MFLLASVVFCRIAWLTYSFLSPQEVMLICSLAYCDRKPIRIWAHVLCIFPVKLLIPSTSCMASRIVSCSLSSQITCPPPPNPRFTSLHLHCLCGIIVFVAFAYHYGFTWRWGGGLHLPFKIHARVNAYDLDRFHWEQAGRVAVASQQVQRTPWRQECCGRLM